MAEYNITGPDGRKFKITGDSPPTEEELEQIFSRMPPAGSQPPSSVSAPMAEDSAFARAQNAPAKVDFPTFALSTPAGKFVENVADLPLGAAQFVSEGLGSDKMTGFMRNRQERIDRGSEAVRSVRPEGAAGVIEEGIDLTARAGGVILPAIASGSFVKQGVNTADKIAKGIGLGAFFGATAPATGEDYEAQKKGQILAGATLGGVIPAAGGIIRNGYQAAKNIVGSITKGGRAGATGRMVGETTDDVDKLIVELRKAPDGATAGQAAAATGNTRLAAMAKALEQRAPDDFAKISVEQATKRIAAIRTISGGSARIPLDDTIAGLKQARQSITAPIYAEAEKATGNIDVSSVIPVISRIIKADPNNSALTSIVNTIKGQLVKTAPRTGRVSISRTQNAPQQRLATTPTELISTSREIGRIISDLDPKTGKPLPEKIVRSLLQIKTQLDEEIGSVVPAFKRANSEWSRLSNLVNRAEIGQRLERILTAPLAGDESSLIAQRAGQFVTALGDEKALVSKVTGYKRNKGLTGLFGEEGVAKLESIVSELQNNAEFSRLAVAGRQGAKKIEGELDVRSPIKILDRVAVIFNAILSETGNVRKELTLNEAAKIFRSGTDLADILEKASPRELTAFRRLIDAIPSEQINRTAPAAAATRE